MSSITRACLISVMVTLSTTTTFAATQHATQKPAPISRNVAEFNTINIGSNFQATVNDGKAQQILIHANASVAKCVQTHVNGTTLYLSRLTTAHCKSTPPIHLTINTPNLKAILTNDHNITTVRNLATQTFLSYSSGRSHLSLIGKTNSLNSIVSEEASVDAKAFQSNHVLASASGNSQLQLQANRSLFINAANNATITYSGKPKTVTKSLSGTSSVVHNVL